MNVIISNKNKTMLDGLNIEVIKRMDGEFSIDEIISTFQNMFFNKMIIDVTAIQNHRDINVLQKLRSAFDMNKIILLLDSEVSKPDFVSKVISLGIYNFTTNLEGIMYLYNNPNTYADVSQYHHIDSMIVDEEPAAKPNVFEFSPVNEDSGEDDSEPSGGSKSISKGGTKIIGIKSVTPGAGSTTLTYLMKKHLQKRYSVLAIEVEKRDFIYFNDNELISSSNGVIGNLLTTNKDKNIILVDLNGSQAAENFCDDVLYLLEPSIIKINRLLSIKPKILNELKGKKVILCPSMLSSKDVKDFEYESGLNVFYNMKPIDDHGDSAEIKELVAKLGYK